MLSGSGLSSGDPATATDAQVAPYADLYLEYNAAKLVTKEIVQGAGACCGGAGGLGAFTFAYSVSGFADGHNTWSRKTVETLPDGNQNIVFTNFAGQVMLKSFKDVAANQQWKRKGVRTLFRFGLSMSTRR